MSTPRSAGSRDSSGLAKGPDPGAERGASSRLGSSGKSAVLAGLLWAAGVAAEIVLKPQRADGSVAAPVVFGIVVAATVAGSFFLIRAFRGTSPLVADLGGSMRARRAGRGCCLAGSVLLLVFSLLTLGSGLAIGDVWEPSFLVFALGMLLLLVGQVTLGLALSRHADKVGGVWLLLVVAGAFVVLALVVPIDPWHDVGMFGLFGAWVALGLALQSRSVSW